MIELLKIPEKEYQKLNQALEQYKTEREQLEEAYRARSKELTKEIHKIEDRIARDKRIRERRGPEYMQYRNKKMLEMNDNGVSFEDLAKEFNISVYTVRNKIERWTYFRLLDRLNKCLEKTEGVVNDLIPIDALLWHKSRQARALKKMDVNTVGDYYKMKTKNKISNNIQEVVENEITWASKRYFDNLKRKQRGNFYYG
jgi:hypothetical protein